MKVELHSHTGESSLCGRLTAKELIELHKDADYDGIVITDHFNKENLNVFQGDPLEQVKQWLNGYEMAKRTGDHVGLRVFFGLEARNLVNENDYLIYGATPKLVLNYPLLYTYSLQQISEICHKEKCLLVQAHPYRLGCMPADVKFLDGVEVYNCNPRHNSQNEKAKELADKNPQLIQIAGSDVHRKEDLAGTSVVIERNVESEIQLYEALSRKEFHIS